MVQATKLAPVEIEMIYVVAGVALITANPVRQPDPGQTLVGGIVSVALETIAS